MVLLCKMNPIVVKHTLKLLSHTGPKNACLAPVMTHAAPLSHASFSQDTAMSRRSKDGYETQVCICVYRCMCACVCSLSSAALTILTQPSCEELFKNAACLKISFKFWPAAGSALSESDTEDLLQLMSSLLHLKQEPHYCI